jgi:acetylornithine deacetylase/succinyl-diaminopimelate desuccinylase-like protein
MLSPKFAHILQNTEVISSTKHRPSAIGMSNISSVSSMNQVFQYVSENENQAVEQLIKLARQPSVSAKGEGIVECAKMVQDMLSDAGASTRLLEVEGANPVVTGEIRSKKNPKKTILFYNHYDVQPPEPLELWESPPFEPAIRDGKIYGRGVADDKAELVGRLKLTEAFLRASGDVPCNFKFLFEGEEEVGSPNLRTFKKNFPESFKADGVIWEFGSVDKNERPEITLGVKGILYVELTAKNATRDAHSSLAAVIDNPAWRLVEALNTLKKGDRILIPGWTDDVRPFSKKEIQLLRKQPSDVESELKSEYEIKKFIGGMRGLEVRKALAGKPTCTICGLTSGYSGPKSKTVLPKEAVAKIDFRLVPDQDSEKLLKKLRRHLDSKGFRDVQITFAECEDPKRTSPEEPISKAAIEAAKAVHGKQPVTKVSAAGTGPMFLFDAPAVCIGGGYVSTRAHAPNENARIDLFVKSMKWVAETVNLFAKDV